MVSFMFQMCRARSTFGSIHSDDAIRTFKAMKAPRRTLDVLREGVRLTLKKGPPIKRVVKNNASANNHPELVTSTLQQWLEAGHVKIIPEHQAKFISPLSVSYKYDASAKKMKRRLCFDSSRFKDRFVFPGSKLPGLRYTRTFIQPHDEIALLDLKSFYFHFTLHEDSQPLVCVKWKLDGVNEVCLQFTVMIWGLQPASAECGLVTRTVTDYLRRRHNILVQVYIDDGICILKGSPYQNLLAFQRVVSVFKAAGFVINYDKIKFPSTEQKILGLWVNTVSMTIHPVKSKDRELIYLYSAFHGQLPLTTLAQLLGKCMALDLSIRIPVKLWFPNTMRCLGQFIDPEDPSSWDQLLNVPPILRQEFQQFIQEYPSYQGAPMHELMPERSFSSQRLPTPPNTRVFAADAGKETAIMLNTNFPQDIEIQRFDDSQKMLSSSHREFLGLKMILRPGIVEDGETVSFLTDSKVLERWMITGTSRSEVASELLQFYKDLDHRNIKLAVAWRPRNVKAISYADRAQRVSADDFGLDHHNLSWLYGILGGRRFQVDVFAHPLCHICPRYFTSEPMAGSHGARGEIQPWDEDGLYYIFPPKSLLHVAVRKIISTPGLQGVLVALDSRQTAFPRLLLDDKNHLPPTTIQYHKRAVHVENPSADFDGYFTGSWHLCHFWWFNNSVTNEDIESRCIHPPGGCPVCPGNPNVDNETKEQYQIKRKKM